MDPELGMQEVRKTYQKSLVPILTEEGAQSVKEHLNNISTCYQHEDYKNALRLTKLMIDYYYFEADCIEDTKEGQAFIEMGGKLRSLEFDLLNADSKYKKTLLLAIEHAGYNVLNSYREDERQ